MAAVLLQTCRCLDVTLTSTQIPFRLKNSSNDIRQIKRTVVGRLNFQQLSEQPLYIYWMQQVIRENSQRMFFPLHDIMVDHSIICTIQPTFINSLNLKCSYMKMNKISITVILQWHPLMKTVSYIQSKTLEKVTNWTFSLDCFINYSFQC